MDLTLDAVSQLSPDEASLKAAKGLVVPAKWPLLGSNAAAFWGECQGSGSKPYQVQVDKSGPAFKCSCPSRKFPCKHGLALLLLHCQQSDKFTASEQPAWVSDWLGSRQDKAEKKAAKQAEVEAAETDPATKAKREETRLKNEEARHKKMRAGLDELELWLKDQIRQGISSLAADPHLGKSLAARMVDAQLPGLAFRLRQWPGIVARNNLWPEVLLAEFGELQLLIDGFRRLPELPEDIQADLHAAVGLTQDKESILTDGEKITDQWLVLGQRVYEEDRLWVRRVWLRGGTCGRMAMLLDFSHGTRQFEHNFLTGSSLKITLAFYRGQGLRALLVDTPVLASTIFPEEQTLAQSLQNLSEKIAQHPWQLTQPLLLHHCHLHYTEANCYALACTGESFLLSIKEDDFWPLLAEAGGKPLHLFGEWENNQLRPLAAWREQFLWSHAG